MRTPAVSVIIPTYNRAHLVSEAIESVLGQSFQDFEIIVVDDGSTDETASQVARYQNRVQYIHKENGGVASARNEGLRHARGRYVAWLDSDDAWLPFKLDLQMKVLENHPDVGLIFSDFSARKPSGTIVYSFRTGYLGAFRRFGNDLSRIFERRETLDYPVLVHGHRLNRVSIYSGQVYEKMLWGNLISTPTLVFRRDLVVQVGDMDESLRVFEDYEFHLRLTRISRAAFVDVPTIFYRCEAEDRLTADRDARRLASQQEQLLRLFERLAEQDPDFRRRNPPWERWFRGRGHSQIARLLALDERQMARRHWREALRYSPLGALTPSLLARLFLPGRIASWLRDLRHGRRVRPAVEAV